MSGTPQNQNEASSEGGGFSKEQIAQLAPLMTNEKYSFGDAIEKIDERESWFIANFSTGAAMARILRPEGRILRDAGDRGTYPAHVQFFNLVDGTPLREYTKLQYHTSAAFLLAKFGMEASGSTFYKLKGRPPFIPEQPIKDFHDVVPIEDYNDITLPRIGLYESPPPRPARQPFQPAQARPAA